MSRRLRVSVLPQDIAEGRRGSDDLNPVALALARTLGVGFNLVRVRPKMIVLYLGHPPVAKFPTPAPVRDWLSAWNAGRPGDPAEFDIL